MFEKGAEDDIELNDLTGEIVDAAMEVHTELGPGLLESAYEECLVFELAERGLKISSQVPLPVDYKGLKLEAGYRLDLMVGNRVIVELKTVEKIQPIHTAQLLSYLRMTKLKIGLLINFHVKRLKDGIKRLANDF